MNAVLGCAFIPESTVLREAEQKKNCLEPVT